MSQIEEVSRLIAENLNGYKVVVEKSTVPVKTSSWIKRTITLYKKSDEDFDVASNPEFLREGSAVVGFPPSRPDHHRRRIRPGPGHARPKSTSKPRTGS